MMLRPLPFASSAVLALALAGCGSSSPADAGGTSNPDGGDDAAYVADPAAEAASTAPTAESASGLAGAKTVSELFVHEDPTLDVTKSAGQNADAVAAQIASSTSGCASAKVTHSSGAVTVSANFGTGCSIDGGSTQISGAANLTVSAASGAITVAFTFASLTVDGVTIDGTLTETTHDDSTFSTVANLTVGGQAVTYDGKLTYNASTKTVTIDGSGTYAPASSPGTTWSFTANGVQHVVGGCYADAGTMTVSKPSTTRSGRATTVSETITFLSTTPSTGQVSVTVQGVTTTETLASYGSCPHA